MKRKDRQTVEAYLEWAYADPKYREFTDRMVCQYLDTGERPDIRAEFRKYLNG